MQSIESFSQRVLRDMSSAVLVLDRKGNIMYINRPASEALELPEDIIPGTEHFELVSDDTYNDAFYEFIFEALYNKDTTHKGRIRYRSPSGKELVFRMSSSYLGKPDADDALIVITMADVTTEDVLRKKIYDSSMTFSTFIFGFAVWMIIYALWEFLKRPIPADFMTHGIEVLSILMLIFIIRRTSLTWKDLGILSDDLGKKIRTAVIAAACSVAFLFALKGIARLIVPTSFEPDAPFFDISRFGLRQVLYIFTAGIQEFLARSVMQGNLKRIIVGKYRAAMSIVLSSLIFAAMHLHFGFLFMAGAAILAGLEGILYEKQQTIVGVWIVHWVFGVCGTLLCLIDH